MGKKTWKDLSTKKWKDMPHWPIVSDHCARNMPKSQRKLWLNWLHIKKLSAGKDSNCAKIAVNWRRMPGRPDMQCVWQAPEWLYLGPKWLALCYKKTCQGKIGLFLSLDQLLLFPIWQDDLVREIWAAALEMACNHLKCAVRYLIMVQGAIWKTVSTLQGVILSGMQLCIMLSEMHFI